MKIELRNGARELFGSKEHEVVLAGPADCVAGHTRILNPLTGEEPTIKWLYQNQIAPIVMTLNGPVRATTPFKKGEDWLFEVTCENGNRFTATLKHLVLSKNRWVYISALHVGDVLVSAHTYEQSPQESTLGLCPSIQKQDVWHWKKKLAGCQGNYLNHFHLCDGQLPLDADSVRAFSQQLNDVHGRNLESCMGGQDNKSKHTYLQAGVLPSTLDFYSQDELQDISFCNQSIPNISLCLCHEYQTYDASFPGWHRHGTSQVFPFSEERIFQDLSYRHYRVQQTQVASIKCVGWGEFFDLTVPEEHHYFAEGFVHHNTGKTYAACLKSHTTCSIVPKVQGVIARKTYSSLVGTVVQTFRRLTQNTPVKAFGGETPSRFIYPNGSQIWLAGLDNPGRALSSERDFIYVNQAEELKLDDWEILLTRCSGRGAVIEHPQIFGDCNPAGTLHWIRQRAKDGKLRMILSRHQDNPELYDSDGWITKEGEKRIGVLKNLTGVRRKRLLEGIWATAEGAVYENFDPAIHVLVRNAKDFYRWYLAMDEGFTNPQVCLLIGSDGDGRWHIFREFYVTGYLETQIVAQAKGWFFDVRSANIGLTDNKPVRCELAAVDNAAPGLIAALNAAGVTAHGGKGALVDSAYTVAKGQISGISKIQDRLAQQKDGRPRLTVDASCINTINEFESYVWKEGKDIPEDENNHSMGALRYLQDVLDHPSGAFESTSQIITPTPNYERLVLDTEHINFGL